MDKLKFSEILNENWHTPDSLLARKPEIIKTPADSLDLSMRAARALPAAKPEKKRVRTDEIRCSRDAQGNRRSISSVGADLATDIARQVVWETRLDAETPYAGEKKPPVDEGQGEENRQQKA